MNIKDVRKRNASSVIFLFYVSWKNSITWSRNELYYNYSPNSYV